MCALALENKRDNDTLFCYIVKLTSSSVDWYFVNRLSLCGHELYCKSESCQEIMALLKIWEKCGVLDIFLVSGTMLSVCEVRMGLVIPT